MFNGCLMMFDYVSWSLVIVANLEDMIWWQDPGRSKNTLNCTPCENESVHWCPMFNASKSSNSHTVSAFTRNMGMIRSILCTYPSVFITFHRPSLSFTRKPMGSENHVANHMELHRSTGLVGALNPSEKKKYSSNGMIKIPVYGTIKNVPNLPVVSWFMMYHGHVQPQHVTANSTYITVSTVSPPRRGVPENKTPKTLWPFHHSGVTSNVHTPF